MNSVLTIECQLCVHDALVYVADVAQQNYVSAIVPKGNVIDVFFKLNIQVAYI